jgi:hypothetical protein
MPQGQLPPCIFFPYIDVQPQLLWNILVYFERVEILQPGFSTPCSQSEEASRMGWVVFHRPVASPLDTKAARTLFAQWQELGRLYEDSGYLTYLKHGGMRMEEEPGWALMREIRQYGTDPGPDLETERLRGQLLLQMAQELDQQRREVLEELLGVTEREKDLMREMGLEAPEETGFSSQPLPSPEEDDFLIPQRLLAWAELLGASGYRESEVLLTMNRLAVEYLVEKALEVGGQKGQMGPVPLLEVRIPLFSPLGSGPTGKMRAALREVRSWVTFCEEMRNLLSEATRITEEAQMRARIPRARALEAYFNDEVKDQLIQRLAFLETHGKGRWAESTMRFLLIPREILLGRANGEEKGPLPIVHLEEK